MTAFMAIASPARADSNLEASGFLGLMDFASDIRLGSALAPEQRPQTAPIFGARLTYTPIRSRASGNLHLDLALEPELSFTPSWTGYGFDEDRPSYFAPVFSYRLNVLIRLGGGFIQPHVIAGVGGATVASPSPYMKKETDPVYVWGIGATMQMIDRWQLRLDAKQNRMPAMDGGTTSSYELLVSVGARFGLAPATSSEHVDIAHAPPKPPEPDRDSDNDGIPDSLDTCPKDPETVNGVDDEDGCPEADPDGDKIIGAADKCPDKAEDYDRFEDNDGCPDEDNDKDGIVDAKDKCPNESETFNGIADDDGCPDQITPAITSALASASKVKFESGRPRLSDKAKAALDRALGMMLNNPKLKVAITVHPDKADAKAAELAKKRADVVKWYLVEQGVAAGQLSPTVGPVVKKAPFLELAVSP